MEKQTLEQAAVGWKRDHMWHDAIELPKGGKRILVCRENGGFTSLCPCEDNIIEVFKDLRVIKWAYIKDVYLFLLSCTEIS